MALRRSLSFQLRPFLLSSLNPHKTLTSQRALTLLPFTSQKTLPSLTFIPSSLRRHFSSSPPPPPSDDDEDDEIGDDEDDWTGEDDDNDNAGSRRVTQSGKSEEEKRQEAEEIGYKVLGRLDLSSENPFKPYEPVFAVVQIGSHQFKVSNGDSIFTEKLKFCDVNDKLVLNKVLMLGSKKETIIGRPILVDASVHAVVEEHALDAKVIIFKKKRRKNYRRTKGHRQELTKLRIIDIQGIDKSEALPTAA